MNILSTLSSSSPSSLSPYLLEDFIVLVQDVLSSMKWELGPICQRYPPKLIQAPPYPSPSPLPPLHIHLKSPLQSPYTSLQPSRAADSESWWPEGSSSIPSGHRCRMVKPKTKNLRPKTKDQKPNISQKPWPNSKYNKKEEDGNQIRTLSDDQSVTNQMLLIFHNQWPMFGL